MPQSIDVGFRGMQNLFQLGDGRVALTYCPVTPINQINDYQLDEWDEPPNDRASDVEMIFSERLYRFPQEEVCQRVGKICVLARLR